MNQGAIVRGDTNAKKMALVFTGDEFADGATQIQEALTKEHIKASFFLTGRFYRNPKFKPIIRSLANDGHYLGAHSDQHLLYNDWVKRDSLLINKVVFDKDLQDNYEAMRSFGITKAEAPFFLPPFEWYNDTIASWTRKAGLQLINLTPGTLSAADYTWPGLKNYRSSEEILLSIKNLVSTTSSGLNGFILLLHIGTDPRRIDKFQQQLPQLIAWLKEKGYQPLRIDQLLKVKTKH